MTLLALVQAAAAPTTASTLTPGGPAAARIAGLWWFALLAVGAVFVLAVALLVAGLLRRRRAAPAGEETGASLREAPAVHESRWIVGGGVLMPVVVLGALFVGTLVTMRAMEAPAAADATTIEVIGHRWWWEVRYPGSGVVTANEIHVPAGRPVRLVLTSVDVIHSLWIPQLNGKTDLIPGQRNTAWIEADHPGRYLGECAEFCGVQHAHMRLTVVADAPATFDRWLADQAATVDTTTVALAEGRRVFHDRSCGWCHSVRGTTAAGTFGPDLTHLASRATLGAGTYPNDAGHLAAWITAPEAAKPGTLMPAVTMSGRELQALIGYLATLH